MIKHPHRHYRSPVRRGIYSLLLVSCVTAGGTIGMHLIEKLSFIDAFYFTAMIVTAQGPMILPKTTEGKLFASLLAFVSVGAVVAALGFFFGPFFGKLWKIGIEKFEDEVALFKQKHGDSGSPHGR